MPLQRGLVYTISVPSTRWPRQNTDETLNPQKTPHISPWRASYGVSFVLYLENDRVNGIALYIFQHTHIHMHTCIRVHVYTHRHTHVHAYVLHTPNTSMFTHIYIHTRRFLGPGPYITTATQRRRNPPNQWQRSSQGKPRPHWPRVQRQRRLAAALWGLISLGPMAFSRCSVVYSLHCCLIAVEYVIIHDVSPISTWLEFNVPACIHIMT